MTARLPIRRALLSVSDKTGLVLLGRALAAHGTELLSTGGTAATLRAGGLAVTEVSDYTGFPEILDGRVKTLVPRIHGGLLGRRDRPEHLAQMQAHGIAPIDLAVVNLYPFEAVAAAADAAPADCIEHIDIGGPALIRAAAKNHEAVVVLTDPAQYVAMMAALQQGGTDLAFRRAMAGAAFARVAAYDTAIAAWFARAHSPTAAGAPAPTEDADPAVPPQVLALSGRLRARLRYGENPHQAAALYATEDDRPGVVSARQVQGKALSFNNLADADAALECVAEFTEAPAVVIVKHANPCGAAVAETPLAAWRAALAGDPVSAFGGIVALNRALDEATAAAIADIFTEVIIAPDATPEAVAALSRKPALRLLLTGALPDPRAPGWLARGVAGGLLVQSRDTGQVAAGDLRVVTRRAPGEAELRSLLFAWRVCKYVKSNAIVLARDGASIGIGAGQMSRLDAARLAVAKAGRTGLATEGAVAASDAFFPFADGLAILAEAGVAAVIQPGGSVRDAEVIAAADAAGIAMVFTGMRHFRH